MHHGMLYLRFLLCISRHRMPYPRFLLCISGCRMLNLRFLLCISGCCYMSCYTGCLTWDSAVYFETKDVLSKFFAVHLRMLHLRFLLHKLYLGTQDDFLGGLLILYDLFLDGRDDKPWVQPLFRQCPRHRPQGPRLNIKVGSRTGQGQVGN